MPDTRKLDELADSLAAGVSTMNVMMRGFEVEQILDARKWNEFLAVRDSVLRLSFLVDNLRRSFHTEALYKTLMGSSYLPQAHRLALAGISDHRPSALTRRSSLDVAELRLGGARRPA